MSRKRIIAYLVMFGAILHHLMSGEYGPFDRLLEIGVFLLIAYDGAIANGFSKYPGLPQLKREQVQEFCGIALGYIQYFLAAIVNGIVYELLKGFIFQFQCRTYLASLIFSNSTVVILQP